MNAATLRTYREMEDALGAAEGDADARVVVVTGEGRAFCAGDDVKTLSLGERVDDAEAHDCHGQRCRRGLRLRHCARVRHADCEEFGSIGLVNRVVAQEDLANETYALARQIAAQAPIARRLAKEALRVGMDWELNGFFDYQGAVQGLCMQTADHLEGSRAFVERREAKFQGR